jgi:hypothetical protein
MCPAHDHLDAVTHDDNDQVLTIAAEVLRGDVLVDVHVRRNPQSRDHDRDQGKRGEVRASMIIIVEMDHEILIDDETGELTLSGLGRLEMIID